MSGAIHDVVAIGGGPFNLGLACLAEPVEDCDVVVLESRDSFAWHPGMMLPDATIQVPFLADLVSLADPTNRFSFLNYLKTTGRLYRFYIKESWFPLRQEFDAYCRWAASALACVRFRHHVTEVTWDDGVYVVRSLTPDGVMEHRGRHVVIGVGTSPYLPDALRSAAGQVVHSADYVPRRDDVLDGRPVTVVGSGQSAAEIFADLLTARRPDTPVTWITRSPRFFPMEYTKLTLEMTSPDYTDYFHALPTAQRDRLNREQRHLYKGISGDTINAIYDALYRLDLAGDPQVRLVTGTSVERCAPQDGDVTLGLRHHDTDTETEHHTAHVIAATGYRPTPTPFLAPLGERVRRLPDGRLDVARDFSLDTDRTLFVHNAEEHTHGLIAPDLGMGAYRNSVILRQVCGREVYPVETRIAFQTFGPLAAPVEAS